MSLRVPKFLTTCRSLIWLAVMASLTAGLKAAGLGWWLALTPVWIVGAIWGGTAFLLYAHEKWGGE